MSDVIKICCKLYVIKMFNYNYVDKYSTVVVNLAKACPSKAYFFSQIYHFSSYKIIYLKKKHFGFIYLYVSESLLFLVYQIIRIGYEFLYARQRRPFVFDNLFFFYTTWTEHSSIDFFAVELLYIQQDYLQFAVVTQIHQKQEQE